MLNKIEIILVIIALLIIYYLVISFGSGHRKKKDQSHKIKKFLLLTYTWTPSFEVWSTIAVTTSPTFFFPKGLQFF